MGIKQHYDEIAKCNHCGFCQAACPVFRTTGHEAGVARGRIALLRALIEERITWDREIEKPLFECLLCRACTANCFPAIATADLIREARAEYFDLLGRDESHRLLFDELLPCPERLRSAAEQPQNPAALELLGILKGDGTTQGKAFRAEIGMASVEGTAERRIGYFVGCRMDIACPDAAKATLRVLRKLGSTVQVLDNCCCGLPPMNYGDPAAAQRLAEKNLRLLANGGFDIIATDCSSLKLRRFSQEVSGALF